MPVCWPCQASEKSCLMIGHRALNCLGLLACMASLLFAILYLEKTLHLDPCPLCILDRIVLAGMGIIFFLSMMHDSKSIFLKIYSLLVVTLSLTGIGLASRHIWLQNLPADRVPECGPDLYFMLETLPFSDVVRRVFTGSGSCAQVDWTFAGLSIPWQTLILFTCLLLLSSLLVTKAWRPRSAGCE